MDQNINDPQLTFIKTRQLLGITQHDEAWCASAEELIAEIGTYIATAEAEVDQTTDPDIRQRATTLIGELISTRQKLERAIDASRSKSPSLLNKLKHTLGLEGQDKDKGTEPDSGSDELGKATSVDPA